MSEQAGPNSYSPAWFDFFHVGILETRTETESSFIRRCCPLPEFARVLDLCCGMGRHARALAAASYTVTGVERDAHAVAVARKQGGGPEYVQADVRDFRPAPGAFDAAVVMSQSFGYFDPDTNRALLAQLGKGLRPGGRLVLDLWTPDFFQPRQGRRAFQLPAGTVQETTRLEGGRLFSRLDYPDGGCDEFDFQVFSVAELEEFIRPLGLRLLVACTGFDAAVPPSDAQPRMQCLCERPPG